VAEFTKGDDEFGVDDYEDGKSSLVIMLTTMGGAERCLEDSPSILV
jgi:hypothetical protein